MLVFYYFEKLTSYHLLMKQWNVSDFLPIWTNLYFLVFWTKQFHFGPECTGDRLILFTTPLLIFYHRKYVTHTSTTTISCVLFCAWFWCVPAFCSPEGRSLVNLLRPYKNQTYDCYFYTKIIHAWCYKSEKHSVSMAEQGF